MDTTAASTLFAWLDPEVWLVTARAGDRRGGLIATFVSPASIVTEMPRVLVGLARHHFTWELVEASGCFALHLIREEQIDWVWRFGLQTGRDQDKLAGLAVRTETTGSPLLEDAIGWLDCRVEARTHSGDRTLYLAQVVQGQVHHFAPPLRFQRLFQLAPAPYLAELKRQRHQDSQRDAEAIAAWRSARSGTSEPEA